MRHNLLRSFSVFGDYSNIYVGQGEQNIKYTKLANEFVQHNMIVSIGEELGFEFDPTSGSAPKPKRTMRPIIFSSNREWGIPFNRDRIDINWTGSTVKSVIEHDDFINKVDLFLATIEKIYDIKYIRIAFNYEEIYYDFPEEKGEKILKTVAATNLSLYNNKPLKEWNVQYAGVENNNSFDRPINLITTVGRGIRNFSWMKNVDCISFHCDCNTAINQKNNLPIESSMARTFLKTYANLPDKLGVELFS